MGSCSVLDAVAARGNAAKMTDGVKWQRLIQDCHDILFKREINCLSQLWRINRLTQKSKTGRGR